MLVSAAQDPDSQHIFRNPRCHPSRSFASLAHLLSLAVLRPPLLTPMINNVRTAARIHPQLIHHRMLR